MMRRNKLIVIAMAFGAMAACGFQPIAFWLASLLGAMGLMILVARASHRWQAFLVGWLWGVAHFTLGNNWIATAFTWQAKMPAWLGYVAVVLLALYLAIFPALAALGAWVFRKNSLAFVTAFAGFWIVSEWLRSWLFSGFAWNPLGVALLGDFHHQGLAWLAPWLGTYGLSGLVILLAGWVRFCLSLAMRDGRSRWGASIALIAPLLLLLPALTSPHAGPTSPQGGPTSPQGDHVAFTLVQPDIRQDHVDDPSLADWHYQQEVSLSQPIMSLGAAKPAHRLVLWPESGLEDYLQSGYPAALYTATTYAGDPVRARDRIARALGPGSLLLTGAVNLVIRSDGVGDWQVAAARNVVTALDDQGQIVGTYAKAHLVPYGEYLPMRPLLSQIGLARLVPGDIDFWPGQGPETLDLGPYGKAGIQICYEITFSGHIIDRAHRPDYIFNPSNDGWFGSWGPPQHLAQARLRAIEEGMPILRSTTNGISAVIDADGLVRQFAEHGAHARLDGVIPSAHPPTWFARWGNHLPLFYALMLLMMALLVRRRAAR